MIGAWLCRLTGHSWKWEWPGTERSAPMLACRRCPEVAWIV